MSLDSGRARTIEAIPNRAAVRLQPRRSKSGSMAHAMAGINRRLPSLLEEFANPIAVARRRLNQLLSIAVRGSQLPSPCPRATTM